MVNKIHIQLKLHYLEGTLAAWVVFYKIGRSLRKIEEKSKLKIEKLHAMILEGDTTQRARESTPHDHAGWSTIVLCSARVMQDL